MESATQLFEQLSTDYNWTLLTNRETDRTARWRAGGADVVKLSFGDEVGRVSRAAMLAYAAVQTAVLATRTGVRILHGNDIRALRVLLLAQRLTRCPLLFTIRDTRPPGEAYPSHWKRVTSKLDMMVTLSEDMSRQVGTRLPIPPAKLRAIPSIVDSRIFRAASPAERRVIRARLGIQPDDFAVGMVAGVFPKKRQLEVIREVLPRLADLPLSVHFVGDFSPTDDAYCRECLDAVTRLQLGSRARFHGFQSDVRAWLVACDIVVVASEREGLARCMIEAMASGTPVVSVDVASAREMLEGPGAGSVVAQDDWGGIAKAIRTLRAEPQKRATMAKAGRTFASEHFAVERISDAWRDLYGSLLRLSRN